MKVQLINIDSKINNLVLMKISAWHKQQGDIVGFDIPDPDLVYVSVIFNSNAWKAKAQKVMYPNSEIIVGGSGIDLFKVLPKEIECIKPDYDLYPSEYSLGFTTRGCIRNCPFCVVPKKEGSLKRGQHIKEWHDPRFDKVVCLDNNITADKKWFFNNTDFILENNLKFNAIQGMDIRLLTYEIAERLKDIRWDGQYHFAFDNMSDEEAVRTGIHILQDVGIDTRRKVSFYVLVGFNTSPLQDKYRCRLLKELNCNPFVMQYNRTAWTRRIAWWANRKKIFWSCDIDGLDRKRYRKQQWSSNMKSLQEVLL